MARHTALALFAGAFLLRVGVLVWSAATGAFPQYWEYEYIARNLLDGLGFRYDHMGVDYLAYVEPLYPGLVAGVYAATGRSTLTLGVLQCALSALVPVTILAYARRTFGPQAALAAGVIAAAHPGLVLYATKLHPFVLDTLALAILALAALRFAERATSARTIQLGIALGACALTRPTALILVAPGLVWLGWRGGGRGLRHGVLAAMIAAAVLAPWAVRNYLVLDTFVLTRTNTAFVFWLGNNPAATGGAGYPERAGGSIFDLAPPDFRARVIAAPDELAKNRLFRDAALAYVREAPLAFVGRFVKKLGYFWWFAPYQGSGYGRGALAAYKAFYAATLVLAILALAAVVRGRIAACAHGVGIVVTMMALISVAQAVFYVDGRHRLAVEPLLAVLAGAGVAVVLARLRGGNARADEV